MHPLSLAIVHRDTSYVLPSTAFFPRAWRMVERVLRVQGTCCEHDGSFSSRAGL